MIDEIKTPKIPDQCPNCFNLYRLVVIKSDGVYSPDHLQCTHCDSTFLIEE